MTVSIIGQGERGGERGVLNTQRGNNKNINITFMKKTSLLIISSFILISCIFPKKDKEKNHLLIDIVTKEKLVSKSLKDSLIKPLIERFILGDINGDNIVDTAFIYTPARIKELRGEKDSLPCNGKCYNKITFSCGFSPIVVEDCIEGKIEAIDDLNEDGNKELIFQTSWFNGTSVDIYIYSFINNKWEFLARTSLYFRDSYKNRVRKINKNKFELIEETWDAKNQVTRDKKRIIRIK